MERPLATTEDYYKATLEGIRKSHTVILTPSEWNALINMSELEWTMLKMTEREFTQKRIDDLEVLRVKTDGEFSYNGNLLNPILPVSGTSLFPIPRRSSSFYQPITGLVEITGSGKYPVYLSGSRVDFKITGNWVGALVLRPDEVRNIRQSIYRKPNDKRIYFEVAGTTIKAWVGNGFTAESMNLEYYTYPKMVYFDENSPTDQDASGPPPPPQQVGSHNSVFEEYQKREIIDIAVRTYLEKVESARYKSMLNEFQIRQNLK